MVVCPNAFFIDTEVLFSDHLYSMTQEHVEALADNAGLRFVRCIEAPDGLEIFQGLVFELESRFSAKSNKARSNCERMVKERKSYLDSWVKLDNALARRTEGYKNIWCFGAGETMDLLRTYAPSTWTKVRGVTMDASQENTINGLPLIPINQIDEQECDCLLLGTRPGSHAN